MEIIFSAFKLAISVLLIWLIIVAAQMGYANLHFTNADNHLADWIDKGTISSDSSYNQALHSISLSNVMHTDNPQYLETLAAIQVKAAYGGYAEKSHLNLALANYNKSLQLRPLWPWAWSSKAITKWRLGEIDDDMWHTLQMLSKVGPYNVTANMTIVNVSLMLISTNSVYAERATLLAAEHYKRGMGNKHAVKLMEAIVKRHKAEDIVADW